MSISSLREFRSCLWVNVCICVCKIAVKVCGSRQTEFKKSVCWAGDLGVHKAECCVLMC